MSFAFKEYLYGGTALPIRTEYITDSEAAVSGTFYKYTSGRLTKCTGSDTAVAFLCIETHVAGTDVLIHVIPVLPGMVFEGTYTGTPDVAFVAGAIACDLDSNGANIDAADVTAGAFTLLSKDTTKTTCKIVANRSIFAQ